MKTCKILSFKNLQYKDFEIFIENSFKNYKKELANCFNSFKDN